MRADFYQRWHSAPNLLKLAMDHQSTMDARGRQPMVDVQVAREQSLIVKLQNIGLWAAVVGLILLLVAQFLSGSSNEQVKTIDELAKEIGFALLIAAVLVFTTERRSKVEF